MKIGVVGSINVDYVLIVDEFVKPGETIKAKELKKFPGGKGANQAVAAAKLSRNRVSMIGLVGKDDDGEWMIKKLESAGVFGITKANDYTGKAFIEVISSGENRIIIYSGANAELTSDKLNMELLENADIVLLQNEIPFETTFEVARWARKRGKIVIFDPAPAQGVNIEILKYVDYITPNESEIKTLSETFFGKFESIERAAELLIETGARSVIAKLGENGVYFRRGLKEVRIPAVKVKAVDTTAAGDVFNGAFAAFLEKGEMEALRLAVKAAAISVTRIGAQSSIPDLEEVME